MHPRRGLWGFVFLLGCGAQAAEGGGAQEPRPAENKAASSAEVGARYVPETASDVLFVNRERLAQNLLGQRLVKWSELRTILPNEVPFASLEDWETRLLGSSDWFYIAADPRAVGVLVGKADRTALDADAALGKARSGMAWPRPDVYALDYSELESAPKLEPQADRLGLADLANHAVVAFVRLEPDQTSPIRAYRFSIGTDYGLNLEAVLDLRPGVDSSAVAANFEAKLAEAAASPMIPLFRVRTVLDHAVVRAEPHSVTISTSLSDVETKNLIELLDVTHDELKAAGTLEAWARGVGERAAATQVFFQPPPARRASPSSSGSTSSPRSGQAGKLGSFSRSFAGGTKPAGIAPEYGTVPEPKADAELERLRKQNEEARKKSDELRDKHLKEQTEYYKNKNEEFRRNQEQHDSKP